MSNSFLNLDAAANYLGVKPSTLKSLVKKGEGPKHLQIGREPMRFRQVDLELFVEQRIETPTAKKAAPKKVTSGRKKAVADPLAIA